MPTLCKRLFITILIFFSLIQITNYAFADDSQIRVFVDNKQIQFITQPFISNGSTLVPFRPVLEALGATVEWDSNTKTVTSRKDDKVVIIQIGSNDSL